MIVFVIIKIIYEILKKVLNGDSIPVAQYNDSTHSCDLIRPPYEFAKCTLDTPVPCAIRNYGCDETENVCKRTYFYSCLDDSDCVNDLICGPNQFCICVSIFFSMHIFYYAFVFVIHKLDNNKYFF